MDTFSLSSDGYLKRDLFLMMARGGGGGRFEAAQGRESKV